MFTFPVAHFKQEDVTSTFSPTDIANINVWYDCSDATKLVTSGSTVTKVINKAPTGASGDLVQDETKAMPQTGGAIGSSSRSAITFNNGVQQTLSAPSGNVVGGDSTFFFVYKGSAVNAGGMYMSGQDLGGGGIMFVPLDSRGGAGGPMISDFTGNRFLNTATNTVLNTGYLFTLTTETAPAVAGENMTAWEGKTLRTDFTRNGVTPTTGGGHRLGSARATGNPAPYFYFAGTIGEVIVYNRVLTGTERGQVQDYLIAKWEI